MSVFPSEIEIILGHHPAINGVAVLGKPDPEEGEVPVAFIQLRPEFSDLSVDAFHSWCQENMATYKVPQIRLIDELPKTPTQKVQKNLLKAAGITPDTWDREAVGITVKREKIGV